MAVQCYIFVDGQYVRTELSRSGQADEFNPRAIVELIANHSEQQGHIMVGPYTTRRLFVYDAIDDSAPMREVERQKRYFERLKKSPYTHVVLGQVRKTTKRREQKGVDVQLAVDAMRAASAKVADVVVLVSGDADFAPLGRAIRDAGPLFFVIAFKQSLSETLASEADRVWALKSVPKDWIFAE